MKRLKMKWKVLLTICAIVAAGLVCGVVYAIAANDIKITFNRGANIEFADAASSLDIFVGLTGRDEDGNQDYSKIEYSTSNDKIFTVAGTVNADKSIIRLIPESAGIAQIEAKYLLSAKDGVGTYTRTFTADVKVPLVIDKGANDVLELKMGETPVQILTNASIYNAITWSYSNENVVKVSSDELTYQTALVAPYGAGKTTVTATTVDGVSASFDAVVGIELTTDNLLIQPEQSISVLDYTNIVNPESVYWRIDPDENGNVVAVVSNGIVTGKKTGTAYLYISTDAGFADEYTQKIRITVPFGWGDTIKTINVGDEFKFTTSMPDAEVTWSTSNKDVLSLSLVNGSPDGTVVGVSEGTAFIRATRAYTDVDGNIKTETIEYAVNVVDRFGISNTEIVINKGVEFSLTALTSNTNATVNWAVADNSIVDFAGVTNKKNITETFKGLKKGSTTIVVTQNVNGVLKSAECKVTVTEPVGSLRIDPAQCSIPKGSTQEVMLFFEPLNADNQNVKWYSNNPSVATVVGDSLGAVITGVSGGKATISAVTEDGLYMAYCEVSVTLPVEKIVLNMHNVNIDMETQFYQLTYTVYPQVDGVCQDVTWSSSNTDVVTVDEKGLVKFIKPGYATVYCQTTDKTYSYATGAPFDSCEFYIKQPVTSITLNHTNESIAIGDTLLFTAAISPNTASNKDVIWSSSNEKVAKIDQNGYMTAVGSGYAAILCKSVSDGITAVCNVYVRQPVTKVVMSNTEMTVRKGTEFYLSATVLPENADNKTVKWSTSDPRIATVTDDGHVVTLATGIVTISATAQDNGTIGFCVVTVTEPVDGITLNSSAERLLVGTKFLIIPTVTPIDATDKSVTFKSSDPNIATVSEDGVVTAIKGGECVITVTTVERGLIASCNITVIEKVASIELDKSFMYLNIGNIATLNAKISNADSVTDKRLLWTSSNSNVATVDQYGRITGLTEGTAVITVTAVDGGGASASCVVKVIVPVTNIKLSTNSATLYVGDSLQLEATISPANASVKKLSWSSSNPEIARVDEDGEVFALSPGKAKITVTSTDDNNVTATCNIYVKESVDASSIRLNSKRLLILAGKGRQLTATVYPRTTNEEIYWESGDTSIIKVSQTGYISAVGVGRCEVLAYSSRTGTSAICEIYSMALSKTHLTIEQYDKFNLYVDGAPSDAKVSFRTSNPRVATISASGEVVARQAGTTTVTATVDGKTMTCTVDVVNIKLDVD